MKVETMKIGDIKPWEDNIRKHPENQIVEFIRSIKMFGQIRPIVIDEENTILAGHGIYEAMQRMEKKTVQVYVAKGLDHNKKIKLMIADNKLYDLGVNDLTLLEKALRSLDDFDVPGFDEEILGIMFDESALTDKLSGYGLLSDDEKDKLISNAGSGDIPDERDDNTSDDNSGTASADDKLKIICPNCGEVIWL